MTEPNQPTPPPEPVEPERKSYPNPKGNDIHSRLLSDELSTALGRPVEVSFITAGQFDDEGTPIPSVIYVMDPDTGDDLTVDPAVVDRVVRAHVRPAPPPSDEDQRAAIRAEMDAATTIATLKAAMLKFVDTF